MGFFFVFFFCVLPIFFHFFSLKTINSIKQNHHIEERKWKEVEKTSESFVSSIPCKIDDDMLAEEKDKR